MLAFFQSPVRWDMGRAIERRVSARKMLSADGGVCLRVSQMLSNLARTGWVFFYDLTPKQTPSTNDQAKPHTAFLLFFHLELDLPTKRPQQRPTTKRATK